MADGEVMVKTYRRIERRVWLTPANSGHAPDPRDDAQILGRVVALPPAPMTRPDLFRA